MKKLVRNNISKSINLLAQKDNKIHIKELLSKERIDSFQIKTDLLSFDYSKQRITKNSFDKLLRIPDEVGLKNAIESITKGESSNFLEGTMAPHCLYRDKESSLDSEESIKAAHQRSKLNNFINNFLEKDINIKSIISIGIGGSRLGPQLLSEVYGSVNSKFKVYYCSSYDFVELDNALSVCNPETTLVIISSKSFDTPEVIANANRAKTWLNKSVVKNLSDRVLGISCNSEKMKKFGIKTSNQFEILDSLGGRYSIWSSMILPALVDLGWNGFEDFTKGAYEADKHFKESPWYKNIPVVMALLSVWNTNGLNINNLGIFSYDYKIRSLSKYLGQLGMESNGKSYNSYDKKTKFYTSPLIWGGYGPESQHSTFQWLLQGTDSSACDFIGVKEETGMSDSYRMLLAQVTAITIGRFDNQSNHKSIEGNNPTSLLILKNLQPKSLGYLLATYEHKVFVEALIYDINPFDQMGVRLGKDLALNTKEHGKNVKEVFNKKLLT